MNWRRGSHPVALATLAIALAACVPVTVNVTFPQEKLDSAARQIEDMPAQGASAPPAPPAPSGGRSVDVASTPRLNERSPEVVKATESRRERRPSFANGRAGAALARRTRDCWWRGRARGAAAGGRGPDSSRERRPAGDLRRVHEGEQHPGERHGSRPERLCQGPAGPLAPQRLDPARERAVGQKDVSRVGARSGRRQRREHGLVRQGSVVPALAASARAGTCGPPARADAPPDRPGRVGEEVAVAVRAVFLDAGNTLVGLDYDTIARRIRAESYPVDVPAVRAAEARARVRLDPLLAARRSTETADVFTRYVRYVLEELGARLGRGERAPRAGPSRRQPALRAVVGVPARGPARLETLRRLGLRLAVVSNSNGTVAGLLEALGLAGWLDAVVDSGVVGFEKPDPRIFRHAAAALGVEPAEAVHVGDLYSVDVVGARAAGARASFSIPSEPGRSTTARRRGTSTRRRA